MFQTAARISNPRFGGFFQDTWFKLGFGSGISVFIVLNYFSYLVSYAEFSRSNPNLESNGTLSWCGTGFVHGFPFDAISTYYGYPSGQDVLILGAAADLLVALFTSFLLGLIFRKIYSLRTDRKKFL